jgi:hypothetical protein
VLTDQELSLLDAERQFRPDGAAARVAEPDALLFVLPVFLSEERWCPTDVDERRAQLLTAGALTRHLAATLNHAEVDCAVTAIAAALEQAAARMRSDPGLRPASSSRSTGAPR